MSDEQIPEQVYLDAAKAFDLDGFYAKGRAESDLSLPGVTANAAFRAAVTSAYRAGQAAAPDGAEQVVQHRVVMGTVEGMWAEISDEDAARQIAETQALGVPPWRMERRIVSIGPAEVIGHGGRSTGAVAADGQDGDGHG